MTQDHSSLKWTRVTVPGILSPLLYEEIHRCYFHMVQMNISSRAWHRACPILNQVKRCTWYVHKLFPILFESLCQINCSHSKPLNKRHGTKCPCLLRCGATALNSSCRLLSFFLFFFHKCNLCVTVFLDHTGHNVPACHGFQLAKTNYINMRTFYIQSVIRVLRLLTLTNQKI